jgi:hypothetical protein
MTKIKNIFEVYFFSLFFLFITDRNKEEVEGRWATTFGV